MDGKRFVPLDGSDAFAGFTHRGVAAVQRRMFPRFLLTSLLFLLSQFLSPAGVHAEVAVDDMVAPVGREVFLRAETKSGFFSRGGALVEFFIDGKPAGKKLSGGDGVAYLPVVPARTGLHRIGAQWEDSRGEGLLLAVQGSAQLVLIDAEGTLREPTSFAMKPRAGSVQAVKRINRRYPVVFLWTGFIGMGAAKSWLKESGFPAAPLVPWGRGDALEAMEKRQLKIRAVIGKPDVVQAAKGYTSHTFSFEVVGDAEAVQGWDEIVKKMK